MFERIFTRVVKAKLRCAVVTPIGPGHSQAYRECEGSVTTAWRSNRGPFTALDLLPIDDSAGKLGRSVARNEGVRKAAAAGAEWIFFLDADDLMLPEAFGQVSDLIDCYDAIWGLIHSRKFGAAEHHLRLPQILSIARIESLFVFDPFLTLQMGHFVRTAAALATPFDHGMNAGEDFDYYLRLWRSFRCAKVPRAFFVARQGRRSQGPRSATAEDWGTAVRSRLAREREQQDLDAESPEALAIKNTAIFDLQAFYRERGLANASNYIALARELPFRGSHRIDIRGAKSFEMYSDNDDLACLSLAWTGEYHDAATRLWQALSRSARVIVDIGAGTGLWSLVAACTANAQITIYCFEPLADNYARLRTNISTNGITNITPVPMAVGHKSGVTTIVVYSPTGLLSSRSIATTGNGQLTRSTSQVTMVGIDEFMRTRGDHLDLVRIDLASLDPGVFSGMTSILSTYRPDILLEMSPSIPTQEIAQLLRAVGYRYFVIDDEASCLTPVAGLTASDEQHRLSYWLTVREDPDVRSLTEQSGNNLALA